MEISVLSRHILRDLCTDSRVTITELAQRYNVSRHVVKERIIGLEKEFGLRYTIEPNYTALGYNSLHIVRTRFVKMPDISEIKAAFAKSRVAQFVAITDGYFQLVTFALARDSIEYIHWETAYMAHFAKYGMSTKQSEINVMNLGFMPINSDAIGESNVEPVYKKMLMILNENSRISIRDMSKQLGFSETLTRYHFRELNKTNIIKRYTALATKSYFKYNILYFVIYTIRAGVENRVAKERRTMYWKQLDEFPVLNEYAANWATSGGDRSFTWACYNDYREGLQKSLNAHKTAYKEDSPIARTAVISQIIKGHAPIRNIDQKESFKTIDWKSELF